MVETRSKCLALKAQKRDELSNPSRSPTNFVSPSTSILGDTAKTVYLIDWWLINVDGKKLGIGGLNSMQNSQLVRFTSAAISKRHSETVVETNDGFVIGIGCLLNRENTLQNRFPLKVCSKFMHGFPYDWEDYRTRDDKSCDLLLSTSCDMIINSVEKTPLSQNLGQRKTTTPNVKHGTPTIQRRVTRSMSRMKLCRAMQNK